MSPGFDAQKINLFKFDLWKTFGIESSKYENIWDYEQYMRLAKPAIAALHALGAGSEFEPCVILSHEYMGMPTVPGGDSRRRAEQLPHDLLCPRSGADAPHRRAQSRARHDVLQRHALGDQPGTLSGRRVRRPERILQARAGEGRRDSATASSPSAITC